MTSKFWTPERDKILRRLRDECLTNHAIAERLGIQRETVNKRVRTLGLPLRPIAGLELTAAREAMLRDLWTRKKLIREIASEFGTSNATINRWAKRLKLPARFAKSDQKRPATATTPIRLNTSIKSVQQPSADVRASLTASTSAAAVLPAARPVKLLDLKDHHCRWPHGDGRASDLFFCGAPANLSSGKPYCTTHAVISRLGSVAGAMAEAAE